MRKKYLKLFFLLSLIITSTIIFLHRHSYKSNLQTLRDKLESLLKAQNNTITYELRILIQDANFLSGVSSFKKWIETNDKKYKLIVTELFFDFAENHRLYDQVRFIDKFGMESIRVNRRGVKTWATDDSKLQDKHLRYYFKNASKLNKESIYLSPLDLNVENGVIERPIQPTIRFAKSIYNKNNDFVGVFVLNYNASHLLNQLEMEAKRSPGQFIILNNKNQWILDSHNNREWGHLLDEKNEVYFKRNFPLTAKEILEANTGLNKEGLFIIRQVSIKQLSEKLYMKNIKSEEILLGKTNTPEVYLKLISQIPLSEINPFHYQIRSYIIFWLLAELILVIFLFYFLKKYQIKKLENINIMKNRIVGLVAHDLKSPLSVINGFANLSLSSEFSEEKKTEFLTRISASSSKMLEMINNLLDTQRLQSESLPLIFKKIELKKIINDVFDELSSRAQQKGVVLNENIDESISLTGDPPLLKEVFINLVSNSIKFCHKDCSVSITATTKNKKVIIKVKDTGVGMEPSLKDRIFSFSEQSSDLGTEGERGTGYGLPLCYEVIQAHNGKIYFESKIGEGTTFFIELPKDSPN